MQFFAEATADTKVNDRNNSFVVIGSPYCWSCRELNSELWKIQIFGARFFNLVTILNKKSDS